MDRIKVVFYSDAPYFGGAEYYLHVLAAGLPRDRFDVRLILRPLDTLEKLRRPLQEAGIPLFEPPEPAFPNPSHWTAVYRYLRDIRPHVFHVNLPGPFNGGNGSIPMVGKMAGVPVVTTEHLPMFRGDLPRRLAKNLSRRFVDRVITVSDENVSCLDRIHGIRGTRVRRVYNGVDLSVYRPNGDSSGARKSLGLDAEERAVGIFGRLDPQKGHDVFLAAAQRVLRAVPKARFLILGEGGLEDHLVRTSQNLGIEGAVRFLGYRTDVAAVLGALDVVVFTSRHEGMPFALLEALAMERPVVATNVRGLAEVVRDGETGRLVEPRDVDAVAGAIVDLLESPDTARALGRRGRERVEADFTVEGMICQTAEIYESLVC